MITPKSEEIMQLVDEHRFVTDPTAAIIIRDKLQAFADEFDGMQYELVEEYPE